MTTHKIHRWLLPMLMVTSIQLNAHEYLEERFLIIHPWAIEAEQGASSVLMGLNIADIIEDDALIGAETPIASNVRFLNADGEPMPADGLALTVGDKADLEQQGPHFLLDDISMSLHWGREYPLTLFFRETGAVEVSFVIGDDDPRARQPRIDFTKMSKQGHILRTY